MTLISLMLVAVGSFYIGIVVGISDCKRRFDIPRGVEHGHYNPGSADSPE